MAIEYTTRLDSKVIDTIKLTDNDGYKTFRKLYNHAQMIKKYVKWDNASSHDYGIMRGNMFLFNDNNCKMVASLKMLDSPELSNIPYFLLNADEFFEYEKTGKKRRQPGDGSSFGSGNDRMFFPERQSDNCGGDSSRESEQ